MDENAMSTTPHHKIIIVGGGPAGLASALHIADRSPELANDILILEGAEYPRPKLCGGGITFHGKEQLERLGLHLDVPACRIDRMVFHLGNQAFTVNYPNAMAVILRQEFDAALAQVVEQRPFSLKTGEKLLDLSVASDGVDLVTTKGRYRADVVIGADGAKSTVRRKLRMRSTKGIARLLRVMTPITPGPSNEEWLRRSARFDFSCILQGIQGYAWDFPCLINQQAYMNRGIFDSRIGPVADQQTIHGHFKRTFTNSLSARAIDLTDIRLEGHPVRWFNPEAPFSQHRVLLTGDAAGVDPMFAEGISFALEYGEIVADVVGEAFRTGDFAFQQYKDRLLNHRLGRLLKRRTIVAQQLYRHKRPKQWSLLWQLAAVAPNIVQRAIAASLGLMPLRRPANTHS